MDLATACKVWDLYAHTWWSADPDLTDDPAHFMRGLADLGIVKRGPFPAEPGRTVAFPTISKTLGTREGTIVKVLDSGDVRVRVRGRADLITMTPGDEVRVCETPREMETRLKAAYGALAAAIDCILLTAPEAITPMLDRWLKFGAPASLKREEERAARYAALAETFDADPEARPAPALAVVPTPAAPQARRVVVVGCSKDKLTHAAPAGELYLGNFHARGRTAADALVSRGEADEVLILSARHGLLDLDDVTAPYDTTWRDADAIPVARLARQMRERGITHVVALTTKDYTARLTEAAATVAAEVTAPLAGSPGILNMNARLARIRRGQPATDAAEAPRCNDWRTDTEPALIADPLRRTVQPALFAV